MNILGINYYYHDSSACIVSKGRLVVAIEEERLLRKKHTHNFPTQAIRRCLKVAGLELADVDAIAVSINPNLHMKEKVAYGMRHARHLKPFLNHEISGRRARQAGLQRWYEEAYGDASRRPKIHAVAHHDSHAAGTFLVSPWDRAALLGVDGAGEWATAFLGSGSDRTIRRISESMFPMSLGSFYEAATEFCGFRTNYDEGKTMGLAPYGDPNRFYKIVDSLISVDDEGVIHTDLSYFDYQYYGYRRCGPKFISTFGQPRAFGQPFEDHHRDVAAAFQKVLEERILKMCRVLREKTKEKNLVIAGGVALNSVANGRIVRESGFDDLYVMPGAGDNGTCIGAAYYVYHVILGYPRSFVHWDPYVGTSYSRQDIEKALKEAKLEAVWVDDVESATADALRQEKIVGWFQGGMEIGPRALGNRSILADPTLPFMKDKINAEVKHREAFRPFAPSVTVEAKDTYFDIRVEDPFMLKVCNVRPEKRAVLPAITHVDGTARLQTVRKEINPRYHKLIEEFAKRSGVPVVLNTSFNVMGEPIVESPVDAIRCFYSTGLDVLVLGNHVLTKQPK